MQTKQLAELIEQEHCKSFKNDPRARGYCDGVVEQLLNGVLGEKIKNDVLAFQNGKTKEQLSAHIRGLRTKHCPPVFKHEEEREAALKKETEAKKAASQVPIVVQATNAGVPGANEVEIGIAYLEAFVRDKLELVEGGKVFCKSEEFLQEGQAVMARCLQWKVAAKSFSDETTLHELYGRIKAAGKNGCLPQVPIGDHLEVQTINTVPPID